VHQTCTLIASLGKAHFNAKFKRMSWEGVCKWDLKKSFGSEMKEMKRCNVFEEYTGNGILKGVSQREKK